MMSVFRLQPLALLAWLSTVVPFEAFAQSDAPAANASAELPLAPIVQGAGAIPAHMLPRDLTPWQMFMDADIVRAAKRCAEFIRNEHPSVVSAWMFHDPRGSRY